MRESPDISFEELMAAIRGRQKFAWLPVRLYDYSGHYPRGWAWRRWVTFKRAIGYPRYYHTTEAP
jgi:hypothetical protein